MDWNAKVELFEQFSGSMSSGSKRNAYCGEFSVQRRTVRQALILEHVNLFIPFAPRCARKALRLDKTRDVELQI
jgi:hypothetical protein